MNTININAAEKLIETLGENLVSLMEYNNGDETNLLVICHKLDLDTLKKLKEIKRAPVVFTEEEIRNATDVFPIELLHIKRHHILLHGENILNDTSVPTLKKYIRQQLEFEFRSKLIHLRQAYMSSDGKNLDNIILAAVPNLYPMIGALIYLKDIPLEYDSDVFMSAYGVDISILKEISDIRKGKSKFKKDKDEYVKQLINILEKIGKTVDAM